MLSEIECEFDTFSLHSRAAGSEESRFESGAQWLGISTIDGVRSHQLATQRPNELCRQRVAAGFAGDNHDLWRLHPSCGWDLVSCTCRVISSARSRARLADSPLTMGVCFSRTQLTKCCNSSFNGSSFTIGTGSRTIRLPANLLTIVESRLARSFFNRELSSSPSRASR